MTTMPKTLVLLLALTSVTAPGVRADEATAPPLTFASSDGARTFRLTLDPGLEPAFLAAGKAPTTRTAEQRNPGARCRVEFRRNPVRADAPGIATLICESSRRAPGLLRLTR